MNHFMARLIFCFFAEDTGIFNSTGLFTATIEQMSARDSSNTHEVIGALFRAMNTPIKDRAAANLRPWADVFPYVNGGLFSGSSDVPRFSRIARSYLLHIGNLDWTKINPDIFGSMIQAVAEDEERGALGLHYTSVPNILKVLTRSSSTICAHAWTRRGTIPACSSTCAGACRGSECSTRPAAPATSWSSPTRKCGRSRPRSTSSAGSRTGAARYPLPTSEGSSCATFRPRSRVSR
jgi:hypothetical protein